METQGRDKGRKCAKARTSFEKHLPCRERRRRPLAFKEALGPQVIPPFGVARICRCFDSVMEADHYGDVSRPRSAADEQTCDLIRPQTAPSGKVNAGDPS